MNDRISRFQQFIDDIRSLETLNLHQYASTDEMWTVWKENFTRIAINMLQKSRKVCNKSNPWINDQLLHEKRHKNYLKQKACKTGNLEDWENCKHARNDNNRLIRIRKNHIRGHPFSTYAKFHEYFTLPPPFVRYCMLLRTSLLYAYACVQENTLEGFSFRTRTPKTT